MPVKGLMPGLMEVGKIKIYHYVIGIFFAIALPMAALITAATMFGNLFQSVVK